MRGFHPAIYDTTVDADRRRMDEDMRADDIGARDFDFEAPFIARLELFRTPVSPEVLLADFGIRRWLDVATRRIADVGAARR
jgi:hypothetical protein